MLSMSKKALCLIYLGLIGCGGDPAADAPDSLVSDLAQRAGAPLFEGMGTFQCR